MDRRIEQPPKQPFGSLSVEQSLFRNENELESERGSRLLLSDCAVIRTREGD